METTMNNVSFFISSTSQSFTLVRNLLYRIPYRAITFWGIIEQYIMKRPSQPSILDWVPAHRCIDTSVQTIHVLFGQFKIKHLGVFFYTGLSNGFRKRNITLFIDQKLVSFHPTFFALFSNRLTFCKLHRIRI